MLNKDALIGKRLRSVRNSLKFTLKEIAEQIGFGNYQILEKIETGNRAIKVSELTELCKIYSKDISYFLQEDEPKEPSISVAWRRTKDDGDVRGVRGRIRFILESYHLLESLTGQTSSSSLIPWKPPENDFTYGDVQIRAEQLINDLELGYRPGINLSTALEEKHDFRIVYLDMEDVASAATAYGDCGVAIFISSQDAPWRRNFDLAHELFHVLSSESFPIEDLPKYETDSKSFPEQLADAFASALLMPKNIIKPEITKRIINNRISRIDLIDIAQELAVSTKALLWRLVTLGMLARDTVIDLIASPEFSSLDKKKRLGWNEPALEYSARFVRLGLKAIKDGKISKGKFCEIFGISKSEFPSFISVRGFSEEFIYKQELEVIST